MSNWATSAEFLTGATILKATRDGLWLCLSTDRGEFQCAGGRVRVGLRCEACGEERLVEVVTDARGDQGFCSVCSKSWPLPKEENA